MNNKVLTFGVCPTCGTKVPGVVLGEQCVLCIETKKHVFNCADVELKVVFVNDGYNFLGTKVMVNGVEGEIEITRDSVGFVGFHNSDPFATPIFGLGYWDLLRINIEQSS